MKRLFCLVGLISLSSTAFAESVQTLMAPDDHEVVDSAQGQPVASNQVPKERAPRFHGNRIPGSWSLKPKGDLGQAEQMLQDVQGPRLLPAAENSNAPVFVGTCQTAQGAAFVSQQDQRNYERCMDQSNRKSGGTTLFSIPNPLTN